MIRKTLAGTAFLLWFHLNAASLAAVETPGFQPGSGNPVIPGYFADPSHVFDGGKHFIYATLDPWGGDTLGCWESTDFGNWTYRTLNWPTKKACTSPTSKGSMVWAPSVVRGVDGKFYMYVSVGSEVWAGVADAPLGPWKDANGGKPLIEWGFRPGYHMIDAEAFIDTDGQAYLYWGSGHNWVNGKCWVVKLKPDMVTFDGEVKDVTPGHYFEGPFMLKHDGRYYLSYSDGKTIEENYQVHYAIGETPLGPFKEAPNSPILVTDHDANISSPGHHAMMEKDGRHFILYHRHSIPFDPKFIGRQICVDELEFTPDGLIQKVKPTHKGPDLIHGRNSEGTKATLFTASSQRNPSTAAARIGDNNHATLWAAAADAPDACIQMDFGTPRELKSQEIRLEYAWKPYRFVIESSTDGTKWETIVDHNTNPASGSPVTIEKPTTARFLKMRFPNLSKDESAGIFEWSVK